jgi:uncharacterized protein YeaO (DUF488 family)
VIRIKRIYERPSPEDGFRVLVDRLWPRGVSKTDAAIDLWLKEAAPSDELRRSYAHQPGHWSEFRSRYHAELAAKPDILTPLREKAAQGTVTLLYAARDQQHNNALALKEFLEA